MLKDIESTFIESSSKKAYGKASIQLDVPNTLDTKFHIALVTKCLLRQQLETTRTRFGSTS